MALTNYSELKSTIADYLNRQDLADIIPTFITLAEAQIARDLRHRNQEVRLISVIDERYEEMPTSFLEIRTIYIDGENPLRYESGTELVKMRAESSISGTPKFYTIHAGQVEFYPSPDKAYEFNIVGYARIPELEDDVDSNWLLAQYPDIYLYGALIHSAPYLEDDARSQIWAQLYGAAIIQANAESDISSVSGSRLVMR
jgi:hypothetical protein